jgi:hypothetical protein
MSEEQTAGQHLAATLRHIKGAGTRTHRWRQGTDLHADMIESIYNATSYPGYYTGDTHRVLTGAWIVYCAYTKHVLGHRIDPLVQRLIGEMSAWQFAGFLGAMLDAGFTSVGVQAEAFFQDMRPAALAIYQPDVHL